METTVEKQPKLYISDKGKRVIVDVICYLYVLLFLYTATSKLINYGISESQMEQSPIISDYASTLVWLVPVIEISIALIIIIPRTKLLGLYAALLLMLVFTAYIYVILNYSSSIPCSCGGIVQNLTWNQHFFLNISFVGLAVLAIFANKNHR